MVALETTLVSHGFSQGRGLLAAQQAEQRVRAAGTGPCTVGVVDGFVRAGLSATPEPPRTRRVRGISRPAWRVRRDPRYLR
ncbi:pseudouridine-5'-phosphate glycosidase [uncultured Mycobacterium sp.]|uniref:pseudouridine-5'-phosphate glycosidase n=1 Tax=uncultured Mycobacterium sp. TaxID=171292 RepID=UPI0035C97B23